MDYAELIKKIPEEEKPEILRLLRALDEAKAREAAQEHFLDFIKLMWPGFILGRQHKVMADAFERVANGELKRLIVNMPPRHSKSECSSYLLPAWFLGRYPEKKVIQTSHTAELAVGFGRKVRNLVDSEEYQKVFPGVGLRSDSKAAGRWSTTKGGEYFAIGVGGSVTGKGADLLIIDDPHSEQEAMMGQFDASVYDKVYEWYSSGPRQRLQPGGAIVIVMCMTGDTSVLMADGSNKKLKDIRIGDFVATYEGGQMSASFVSNFQSSGFDDIVKIQTQSGRIIRANKEHPFLVEHNGVRKWARVKDLTVGMSLVGTTDANGPLGLRINPDFAAHVKRGSRTTEEIQTLQDCQSGIMGNGGGKSVLAESPSQARDFANHATQSSTLRPSKVQKKTEPDESSIGTESPFSSTRKWLLSATTGVTSAAKSLLQRTLALTGMESFASIIATKLGEFAASCATTATFLLDTARVRKILRGLRNTYDFEADVIVRVTDAGRAEVFDLEVYQTENFIANGVVSHNTRWAKRDLTGQIIDASIKKEGSSDWEVIELPAILPSGEPLWPEFWSIDELQKLKTELPISKWSAQYQQDPTSEEGALIKRDWWNVWEGERAPPCEAVIIAMDTAFSKTERSDYSACVCFGVFNHPNATGKPIPNLILLDAWKEKLEFPELKAATVQYYKDWKPDMFIVEKKASGAPLIAELRNAGIPVQEFTPTRATGDKIVRVNSITDIFASGVVWAPDEAYAEEVVEECAAFPSGDHDDYVDAVTMALMRFRQGGFVIPTDEDDTIELPKFRKEAFY
jgi:predicted phage terminase large subunit-like protein